VLITPTDYVQDLKILNLFTTLPIHFQLNLNTNTERARELTQCKLLGIICHLRYFVKYEITFRVNIDSYYN